MVRENPGSTPHAEHSYLDMVPFIQRLSRNSQNGDNKTTNRKPGSGARIPKVMIQPSQRTGRGRALCKPFAAEAIGELPAKLSSAARSPELFPPSRRTIKIK